MQACTANVDIVQNTAREMSFLSVLSISFFAVGSVHAGPTIQTIQGASLPSLSSQPASLVSTPFPTEDETHSQPISQQGLHYLHSAYRVGEKQ